MCNIANFNPDGSPHYEVFLFKGVSLPLSGTGNRFEHHYESLTARRFYPSGKVKQGDFFPVHTSLARVAETEFAAQKDFELIADSPRAARLRVLQYPFVRSVRGRFFGWAAVNLQGFLATGKIAVGDVQLSNPTHPVAGPMTNTRLFGTFRGKLSDLDADGVLDLNLIPCHGTTAGELDLNCDGTKIEDPFA